MEKKTVFRYIRPGDISALERELDEFSARGLVCPKPGRLIRRYQSGPAGLWHRIGCSLTGPGSADEITYLAAQERAGWKLAARKKNWLLFTRPVGAEEKPGLTTGREPVKAHFAPVIKGWESFRRWMLVLGFLLMLGGYVSDILPLLYSSVIPLAAAGVVTYVIKFLEEGPET